MADGSNRMILFISGVERDSPKWKAAVEKLGFVASRSSYLAMMISGSEKIRPSMFHPVWPRAMLQSMPAQEVLVSLSARDRQQRLAPGLAPDSTVPSAAALQQQRIDEENRRMQISLGEVRQLSRNLDGNRVYDSALGRFVEGADGKRIFERESRVARPELFLRVIGDDLTFAADGFVQSMLQGEVQHQSNLNDFLYAVYERERDQVLPQELEAARAAIDAANVRHLNRVFDTAQDAYGISSMLYQYLPQREQGSLGAGAMPLPLSVIAQRLLGDTQDQDVHVPHAFDGASFAFLSRGTRIHAYSGGKDLSGFVRDLREGETRWSSDFFGRDVQNVDAIFFNADPNRLDNGGGMREDYRDAMVALKRLRPGGRGVLVLAGDGLGEGEMSEESRDFMTAMGYRFDIESAVEVNAALMRGVGGSTALRLISVRSSSAHAQSWRGDRFEVVNDWDELKSWVDEEIVRLEIREAQAEEIDLEAVRRDNEFQRPYLAFSRVGESRTMVPRNLQGPLQHALTRIEQERGQVDEYVAGQLGYGPETLRDRFSPEQVDALAITFRAWEKGRAPIIGDDTGIGKGRVCAASIAVALRKLQAMEDAGDERLKKGGGVIFITERAGLFSDMMRDLRDTGEFGRVRPLLMNGNSSLTDIFTGELVSKGMPLKQLTSMIEEGALWRDTNANLIFMTYSQISGKESIKADWVRKLAASSAVLCDESHAAAGNNSNISSVITDVMNNAVFATYLSATWSKSSRNLSVYRRALPDLINVGTLADTMKVGGEPFAEVFSSMLAKDGVFIRREHDLSKLTFDVSIDTVNRKRNESLSDKTAEILAAMTYFNGDLGKLLSKFNRETIRILSEGRDARKDLGNSGASMLSGNFGGGSVLHVVMRRLLTMLNVDNVQELTEQAIDENRKPIIFFDETGEAYVRSRIEQEVIVGPDGERLMPTEIVVPNLRDILREVAQKMLMLSVREVTEEDLTMDDAALTRLARGENQGQAEEGQEGQGNAPEDGAEDAPEPAAPTRLAAEADLGAAAAAETRVLRQGGAQPSRMAATRENLLLRGVENEVVNRLFAAHEKILELVDQLPPIPINVVDLVQMRSEAQGLVTGEISGRGYKLRPVDREMWTAPLDSPAWATARWRLIPRRKEEEKAQSRDDFNNGRCDVIYLNRAGSAGLSLHASPRFADTRQRQSIDLQISEDPTTRLQLNGRANRYDQVITPRHVTSTSGIYGETRQVMMQNKKLATLSANTRSSRESPAELAHVPDLLNRVGEGVAREYLLENGGIMRRMGISLDELGSSSFNAINRLTSRAVLLTTAEQRSMYAELERMFDEEVQRLEEAGGNPLRTKEMDVRARELDSQIFIGVDGVRMRSAFDEPVYLKTLAWEEDFKGRTTTELFLDCQKEMMRLVDAGHARWVPDSDEDQALQARERAQRMQDGWLPGADHGAVHGAQLSSDVPTWQAQALSRAAELDDQEREGSAPGMLLPRIDMSQMLEKLDMIMQARIAIELNASEFNTEAAAMLAAVQTGQENTVANLSLQRLWLQDNFRDLQPGTALSIPKVWSQGSGQAGKRGSTQNEASYQAMLGIASPGLLMGLDVPEADVMAQLSRWRVRVWMPETATMRSMSLQQVMRGPVMVTDGAGQQRCVSDVRLRGPAFVAPQERGFDAQSIHRLTHDARPMKRTRKAAFLTGNMYLASEWAMSNEAGRGVVYSDANGVFHRGVHLNMRADEMERLRHSMPVRLWVQESVYKILGRAMSAHSASELAPGLVSEDHHFHLGSHAVWRFFTRYRDASREGAATRDFQGKGGMILNVVPGKGVLVETGQMKPAQVANQLRAVRKEILRTMVPDFHLVWRGLTPAQRSSLQDRVFEVTSTSGRGNKLRGVMLALPESGGAMGEGHPLHPLSRVSASQRHPDEITAENFWLSRDERFTMVVDALYKTVGLDLYVPRTQTISNPYYLYKYAAQVQRDYFLERGLQEAGGEEGLEALRELEQDTDTEVDRGQQMRGGMQAG